MFGKTIHLRAEPAPSGTRAIITPDTARQLLAQGYKLNIERSPVRFFSDDSYAAVGARLVAAGSWVNAPSDHIIVGMKGLPEADFPLKHVHAHAAHAFRNQAGWEKKLKRFERGGGLLLELEFLVNDNGEKLLTFGREAGAMAAALSIKTWAHQLEHPGVPQPAVPMYDSLSDLVEDAKHALTVGRQLSKGRHPTVIITGAYGTSGTGACEFFNTLNIPTANVTKWGRAETGAKDTYPEILQHDIFINSVSLFAPVPPFITPACLSAPDRKLSVICDISTDSKSPNNTVQLPGYWEYTTAKEPTIQIPVATGPPLRVIAVPYLPSLLPRDSSDTASTALYPAISKLGDFRSHRLWRDSEQMFRDKLEEASSVNQARL